MMRGLAISFLAFNYQSTMVYPVPSWLDLMVNQLENGSKSSGAELFGPQSMGISGISFRGSNNSTKHVCYLLETDYSGYTHGYPAPFCMAPEMPIHDGPRHYCSTTG